MSKWTESGAPHRGWSCIDIQDAGEPSHLCEMCETQHVRYVHTMEHPDYADTLDVGCVCAGNMEQDYAAARQRENQFKQTKARRTRWLQRDWLMSGSGNTYINTDGFNVVVFRQGGFWSSRVEHRVSSRKMFAQARYRTAEQAKLAAFDAMLELKEKMKARREQDDQLSTKAVTDVDQLKALRTRWRENDRGFSDFANVIWSGYRLASPIGRLVDKSICHDCAGSRLTDAIYDLGGTDTREENAWRDADCRSPAAIAISTHYNAYGRVPLASSDRCAPNVLIDAIHYVRERVAILVDVDKALADRSAAKDLRAWRRLLALLEAEVNRNSLERPSRGQSLLGDSANHRSPTHSAAKTSGSSINMNENVSDVDLDCQSDADRRQLRKLEDMMLARGYVRDPRHGFWVLPGAVMTLPAVEMIDDDDDQP